MGSSRFSSDGTLYDYNSAVVDGTWYHCNFYGWQNVDGKYTRRLFFAEMSGDLLTKYGDKMEHLTVRACLALERGEPSGGCSVCRDVLHPAHGYLKGVCRPVQCDPVFGSPPKYLPYPNFMLFPHPVYERSRKAIKFYNRMNGTDYRLVDALVSNGLVSDGAWLHYNFTAKAPGESSPHKHFFAEMLGVPNYTHLTFSWDVTACLILEEGKTTNGCLLCPDKAVIHPADGFLKGLNDKNDSSQADQGRF